jgi:hypothetical protein
MKRDREREREREREDGKYFGNKKRSEAKHVKWVLSLTHFFLLFSLTLSLFFCLSPTAIHALLGR